jgi:hypothetical protein
MTLLPLRSARQSSVRRIVMNDKPNGTFGYITPQIPALDLTEIKADTEFSGQICVWKGPQRSFETKEGNL